MSKSKEARELDEFASGSGVRAVSNGRMAAKCGPEGLQSPSAAESPKQDLCGRRAASTPRIQPVDSWRCARAGRSEGMRGLAGKTSKSEGLVSGSDGDN